VSKPSNEYHENISKSSNTDESIKTAPDGRLIIVDKHSAPFLQSGKHYILNYI